MNLPFVPTPDAIAAACCEIQATWSPSERMRRMRGTCRTKLSRHHEMARDGITTRRQATPRWVF
jgi:hypothetical protein